MGPETVTVQPQLRTTNVMAEQPRTRSGRPYSRIPVPAVEGSQLEQPAKDFVYETPVAPLAGVISNPTAETSRTVYRTLTPTVLRTTQQGSQPTAANTDAIDDSPLGGRGIQPEPPATAKVDPLADNTAMFALLRQMQADIASLRQELPPVAQKIEPAVEHPML